MGRLVITMHDPKGINRPHKQVAQVTQILHTPHKAHWLTALCLMLVLIALVLIATLLAVFAPRPCLLLPLPLLGRTWAATATERVNRMKATAPCILRPIPMVLTPPKTGMPGHARLDRSLVTWCVCARATSRIHVMNPPAKKTNKHVRPRWC